MRGINLAGTSTRILAKHDAGNAVEVKYQPAMTVEESAVVASPDIVSSGFKKESGSYSSKITVCLQGNAKNPNHNNS